ncbi:MAG: hypothetical protein ACI33J_07695 [Clostridium sp.]
MCEILRDYSKNANFDALSEVEIKAIKHWIRNTIDNQLAESAIKILESKREDVEVMVANNMFILTEFREKAEKEGLQKGLERGLQQGLQQGIEQTKIENARNLFDVLDDETISKRIKLDLDRVKKLRE